MKGKKIFGLVILGILIIVLGITLKLINEIKYPFAKNKNVVQVEVQKGDSLFDVIENLKIQGLIKNKYFIKFYIKNKKFNTNIKPGKYNVSNQISIKDFINILNSGSQNENFIKVTIPEGYDIEHIAQLFENKGITSKEEFIKSCIEYKVPSFIKIKGKVKYSLEGYLFPDTYRFEKKSSNKEIISIMLNRFQKVLQDIEKENGQKIDNLHKIITAASMVEKEARVAPDRSKIASVFYNREKKDMLLQIDATILYALGDTKEKLYLKDLKINSPYNTYKIKGFPPGPICSPGKACIIAALNPKKTDYIYYVLEDGKKHYFTKSYEDFLKAKKRYKEQFK